MFDGLKDKLSNFREDAEEVAEENAEELDDPEAEAVEGDEAAAAESEEAGAADAAAVEAEPDEAAEAAAEPAEAEAPEPDSLDEEDAGAEAEVEPAEESEAEAEDESGEEAEDDSSGGGFVSKATSFARGRVVIEEEDLEEPLRELEFALLESDVEMSVAEEILDQIRSDLVGEERKFTESTGALVEDALRDALLSVIDVNGFDFEEAIAAAEKPVTVVFTGVNGVGKTTTIAKLSKRLEDQGYSVVLANGDTYRAGANEQLQEHADNLGVKLISHEQGGDPTAVVYDAVEYAEANDIDVVLGDTAGRLHTSDDLMSQLEKLDRVVDPDYTVFVDEAVAGQDAVNRASEFDSAAAIDGTILTMADADSQGGAAISVARVTGKPILFLGTGQGYDDLRKFDPEALVDDLLEEDEE
ncbi:signal recognition particle-docking protein FtsY [Halobacterium sp. R2-5]|uniref:signal recognition particle-docking protein FtsY n=1 Tax=Halobacterium sp. R2-5 TaxID=2715751 RepID=UPI0014204FE9|nr:signal recognition particle-docking protein FtsY [Halobacterium sp. R2-5]NIB98226.1 signal recognition particle-docking protein FtsY [Halobacterium sp. R2-5]